LADGGKKDQIFTRVNLLKSQLRAAADSDTIQSLEQQYVDALERLDQHTVICSKRHN
jgi:hypothetical protein